MAHAHIGFQGVIYKQLVLSDEFPTRHPLFPVTMPDSTQCLTQTQA